MRPTFLLAAILLLSVAPARAAEEAKPDKAATEKSGPVSWLLRKLPLPKFGGKDKAAKWKNLVLKMTVDPAEVSLGATKQLQVTLTVTNEGKKLVQLDFPTSQRIEVIVKNAAGKMIEQWSEDQAFTNDPTVVTINPGEKLVYSANVSTRDMSAGQSYTITGFFPNYEQLATATVIVPGK
jgi:Intracellular proteinase inhibitor